MNITAYIYACLAAIAAGFINALAGGGTLITFPVLMAVGIPAISANVTNTIALLPGYLGGTLAQAHDLKDQKKCIWMFVPAGLLGGLAGGILLLNTREKLFTDLIPILILLASTLLAVQNPVRNWLIRNQSGDPARTLNPLWAFFPILLACIYGGYFGAGLSVIILAVIGLVLRDNLTHLNALKQIIAFSTNIAAAVFFVLRGNVIWSMALVMAVGALIGGAIGGRLASKVNPSTLRWVVVTIGFVVGLVYLVKTYILP